MSAIDRIRELRRSSNGIISGPSPSSAATYSDPHGRDKIRLGQEMERDLGHYSFNNSIADSNGSPRRGIPDDHTRDYSLDYRGGESDTDNSNEFFPRAPAPSAQDLSKHFRDFSMQGIDTSLESVEMPRGPGKEMGTPELDLKDFDRPAYNKRNIVNDDDLSSQLHSPSFHGRSASLSDFGGSDIKRPFSPIEKYGKGGLRNLPSNLDRELKTASTPRVKQQLPERPRSAFVERSAKPSPPFQRPGNPVGRTIERDYATKPAMSTLPRSFKDSTQLFNDLGITNTVNLNPKERETPTRNHSFRLPDMTGIHSLINTTPKVNNHRNPPPPKHFSIESIPIPKEEEDIISGLRTLQEKVNFLTSENNQQRTRVRELEDDLRHQRRLYDIERARANEAENQMFRKSSNDSGFGSVGDSDEALERQKASHAKERMKWENQLVALKSKISLLEVQLVSERERTKRLQEERDEAVRATAQAINESEGIKSENRALKSEIASLRKQFQENTKPVQSQKPTTARERIKERVDAERRKTHAQKGRGQRDTEVAADRSFIQPDEIEKLRNEIRILREANGKQTNSEKDPKAKVGSSQTVDQETKDAQGNTIRIQLENAKERKDNKGQKSRRRRIRKVIVESDLSSTEGDGDFENDVTSDSSDEVYEEEVYGKHKRSIPIEPWLRPPGQSKFPSVKTEIQNIIDGLANHNAASCTVCSRKRRLKGKKNDPFSRKPLGEVHLNDLAEPLYEEGVSIRPSVPPKQALSSVLDQLKDEFHHLQLQYRDLTTEYEGLDPGHGKRKRKVIAEKLRGILEDFEAKADQIYALYDVVEGAKLDGLGGQSRRGWLEL